ncbi:MAG: DNA-binding HxlR family transcriptional regulator [Saprospiraceae bacterium]|jgi:DNA-binding HxlR family transcriptional regulator
MSNLNKLLHQELRLSIISFLVTIESADFNKLIEVTSATKGNLSVQISKLQQAKYIAVKKSFKGNYPHTECKITKLGRTEFEIYVENLKQMLNL